MDLSYGGLPIRRSLPAACSSLVAESLWLFPFFNPLQLEHFNERKMTMKTKTTIGLLAGGIGAVLRATDGK